MYDVIMSVEAVTLPAMGYDVILSVEAITLPAMGLGGGGVGWGMKS